MKGTNLGELEELVLLMVANLYGEAYGLAIKNEVIQKCDRSVSLGTVHATLHRLEDKGYLNSHYDDTASGSRGGRPKLLFKVTNSGESALKHNRELRNQLWDTIPKLEFGQK